MMPIRAILSAVVCFAACAVSAGEPPAAWIEFSATNLTVTESADASIRLRIPPLKAPYENQPPILNQRPPHVVAPFLEQDWKPDAIVPGSISQLRPGGARHGSEVRYFSLNNYVSNDIFSSMRDPFSFFNDDPFERLGPKPQRFPFLGERDEKGNWIFTIRIPRFTAKTPGKARFEPVSIDVPVVDSVASGGRVRLKTYHLRTRATDVTVSSPPEEGRPAEWCGAIGRSLSVTAALDTNVCTAGDPLVFTMEIKGDVAQETLLPPDVARCVKTPFFRVDAASVKTETMQDGKRFTWRVRALKAGTMEFPAVTVAYYDIAKRVYVPAVSEAIPIQVKAGAQAALGLLEDEDETFPVPDGLDLAFPVSGNADFTLRRAFSLAVRASKPKDFAAAAEAYLGYLETKTGLTCEVKARHLCNLASLRYMAEDWRGSLSGFMAAERLAGETPASLRGVRAAWARLKNDPRAEVPLQRMLFPFWYKYSMPVRISIAAGGLVALLLLFVAAARTGSRFAVLFIAFGLAPCADAQIFNFNMGGNAGADIKGAMKTEPSQVVAGQPFSFVIELDVDEGVGVEQLRVSDMPDPEGGAIEYGGAFESLTDGKSSAPGRALRRFAMKARFLVPFSGNISPVVSGMAVTRRKSRFGSSSFMSSFNLRLAEFKIDVQPLPEKGRPKDFSGAVGNSFRLRETLKPERVRPGDLVTVTYTLSYDGYFPPAAEPEIEGWGKDFKVWDIKEKSRKPGEIVWEQMVSPQSVSATNAASASVEYYDLAARRYSVARSGRRKLVFVSAEKASTENTAVTVTGTGEETLEKDSGSERAEVTLEVRFAPSAVSPVLFRLPPGSAYDELAENGAWLRISTPKGVGWIKR